MSRKLKGMVVVLVLFIVWIIIAPLLAKNLVVAKSLEKANVILVLGGSATYIERTKKASEIYKKGVSKKVWLTDDGGFAGWSQKEKRNPAFVDLAKMELIALGIPEADIEIFKPKGSGTIYEAEFISQKLDERNWESIMLVTSAYHTRRALKTFKQKTSGKKIEIGVVAAPPGVQTPSMFTWWLSPRGWRMVAGEYVKSFVYWIYY